MLFKHQNLILNFIKVVENILLINVRVLIKKIVWNQCIKKNQISDDDSKAQVKRVIREERIYLNADHALFFACHFDILKFCNDIPIGNKIHLKYSFALSFYI